MFTLEEKTKALQLLIKYDGAYTQVIRESGYPSRPTLTKWIEELEPEKRKHCYTSSPVSWSIPRKGYAPDNAACEGFFCIIKTEFFYSRSWKGVSIDQFMNELNEYLSWYAEDRIKMSLRGLSPLEYRRSLGLAS